ncbi:hypothetical protein Riv7116_6224 [Rivularia sp. PCC 7116]|uniref:hypothetical protein n=1 Tax=Rivularia sp. PCC 7116 TaxID=373994 RepID=UPI00029F15C0|nr:hypothetical protein [Rivularia sp. PCC 7116]AFY58573.1 hypothetical protein Riv7116_6224 [Rivularia sp. PCC 7116]
MGNTVTMNASSRYWKIWRIDPAAQRLGYKQVLVTAAEDFAHSKFSETKEGDKQNILLSCFNGKENDVEIRERALAGLCLRCYVSEVILKACKKLDSLFSGEKQFTYRELLPFVLNDDGQKLIVLDKDGKTQLTVDDNSQTKVSPYKYFSVTVLQTFDAELQSRMSLENWVYLQTKQNTELKKYLSEFGFKNLSDWALLNKIRKKQLKDLSQQERYIVEAFHAVYRRDRQQLKNKGNKKCPDPSSAQLQEMIIYLQQKPVRINTPVELMEQLQQIGLQLRSYDIWSTRESLDIYDAESGSYATRRDLPAFSVDEVDLEQQEFLQFLHLHLQTVLTQTIEQVIEANIQKLQKSKRYSPFAQKYIQGLYFYYSEAISLKELAPKLGMSSWDQARRILNPGELLSKVRAKTVEQMLEGILKKAAEKGLTKIPPEANYLLALTEQIESYLDGEIFQQAAEEIRVGTNRKMSGVYANQLLAYIQRLLPESHG